MKKLMRIALENHDEDCEPQTAVELMDNFTVLDSLAAELDESSDFFAENMRAVDNLDRLRQTIDLTVGTQLSPGEVATMFLATESIYDAVGLKAPRSLAFEAEADRETVLTRLKEASTKLLQAIIEALKKAYNWVRDYYSRVTAEGAVVERYALATAKRVKNMIGEPRNPTFTSLTIAKRLRLESPREELLKVFTRSHEYVNDASQAAFGEHVVLLNSVLQSFEKDQDAARLIDSLPAVIGKAYNDVFDHGPVDHYGDVHAPSGCSVYYTNPLLGGVIGYGIIPGSEETLRHLKLAMAQDPKAKASDAVDAELAVASRAEADKLVKIALSIATTVRLFQREQAQIDQFSKKLEQTLDRLRQGDADLAPQAKSFLRELMSVGPTLTLGLHQQAFRHGLAASRAVLDYVSKSAEQYGEKPTGT